MLGLLRKALQGRPRQVRRMLAVPVHVTVISKSDEEPVACSL